MIVVAIGNAWSIEITFCLCAGHGGDSREIRRSVEAILLFRRPERTWKLYIRQDLFLTRPDRDLRRAYINIYILYTYIFVVADWLLPCVTAWPAEGRVAVPLDEIPFRSPVHSCRNNANVIRWPNERGFTPAVPHFVFYHDLSRAGGTMPVCNACSFYSPRYRIFLPHLRSIDERRAETKPQRGCSSSLSI